MELTRDELLWLKEILSFVPSRFALYEADRRKLKSINEKLIIAMVDMAFQGELDSEE